jgi:hypothetical protein
MLQLLGEIAPLAKTLLGTIDKAVPDKDLAQKIKAEFNNELLNADMSKFKAAASIVESEAKSQHWVTATWRPALMWCLIIIVFNNYILMPYVKYFFAVEITLNIPQDLWTLLQIGLGGYVVGRSGESIAKNFKKK